MPQYCVTVRVVSTYTVPAVEAGDESDACLLAMDIIDNSDPPMQADSVDMPMDDAEATLMGSLIQ